VNGQVEAVSLQYTFDALGPLMDGRRSELRDARRTFGVNGEVTRFGLGWKFSVGKELGRGGGRSGQVRSGRLRIEKKGVLAVRVRKNAGAERTAVEGERSRRYGRAG